MNTARIRHAILVACALLCASPGATAADYYAGLDAFKAGDFETAMNQWLPLAKQGDSLAQYRVARLFANGHGVAQDHATAASWFERAANNGYAPAANDLGQLFEQGRGVDQDDAAAAGWFLVAAEAGRAVAQGNLAMMYDQGRGVEQSDREALRWYRMAAQQGNARAQNNLGLMYERGRGVAADDAEAVKWYRKAARQDYAAAQFNLGLMFEKGRGVEQDRAKASKWYHRAAEAGMDEARRRLDTLYVASTEPRAPDPAQEDPGATTAGVAAPPGSADSDAPASATSTSPNSSPSTAAPPPAEATGAKTAAPESTGGTRASYEIPEAPRMSELHAAAAAGDADAQDELGTAYATGRGVAPNPVEAGRWYLRAADQGHAMAGYHLAFMYLRGRGVSERKDFVRAYAWFQISAERGVGDAASWRDKIGKKMSKEELVEARDFAANHGTTIRE